MTTAPVTLSEVIVNAEDAALSDASRATRFDHPILLAPVVGAFLQMFWTHSVPWLLWPLLVIGAALLTRVLHERARRTRERPATLGVDGLELQDRFLGVLDLIGVERQGEFVWVTTRTKERIELRAEASDLEKAARVTEALSRTIAGAARDSAAERALTQLAPETLLPTTGERPYRTTTLDPERCLTVLQDPAASIEARVAAAELLGRHPDTDRGIRLRIAETAATTANPALRDVLGDEIRAARSSTRPSRD
jgi:hypothetical protein